ncbi:MULTISPECIES: helix-turn-helix domain-containing protein [unclassified Mesorhizobium]|uniref:helix-turn-helix domain-containing protein n=1 Tax=unclassified Mesorhizobium TaxID=325217 RepID=UPI000F75400C|nr:MULTISPECIES: helix-turn-helix domain-containing protein [unclassified Mesorhizobium]AZO71780.1 AraC family transcriptional regulator [Mesorhizobium sp. M1D.F.Ca.ET.043.01.1.1]RWA82698.1 MAG: helix-turn-helix domain-containing protein [Mesorhizobium sp.]RWE15232.1 MAG: helix-turn-helix domain-containing protein [Mesorhizobium sp.]
MTTWPSSPSYRDVLLGPDDLTSAASGLPVKVDRLSAGWLPSRIRQIQSPGKWALDLPEFNCAFRARGGFDQDSVALVAIERACGSTICGIPLEDDLILAIPAGTSVTATVRPGLNYAVAIVPAATWMEIQSIAAGMVLEQINNHPAAVRLATDEAQRTRRQIKSMADHLGTVAGDSALLGQPPGAFLDYLGAAADAFAGADSRETGTAGSASRHFRQASAAEDFIRTHIREDIPIVRLCKEIGVSRRQLEYAFRTTFAATPLEFIRALRLNEARRLLTTARANGLSVTTVAMDVGVNHLGRFAASYRLFFGESPKQTLQRAGRT